jgi:hypothetical protein
MNGRKFSGGGARAIDDLDFEGVPQHVLITVLE